MVFAKGEPATPTGLKEAPEPIAVPPDDAVYQLRVPGILYVTSIEIASTSPV